MELGKDQKKTGKCHTESEECDRHCSDGKRFPQKDGRERESEQQKYARKIKEMQDERELMRRLRKSLKTG
jgi:hypothetical protein